MNLKRVSNDKDNQTSHLSSFDVDDQLDIPELDKYESDQLKQLVHQQLLAYAQERKINKKTLKQLTEIVSEFLGCFVLLGYNYTGEPVTIVTCKNQQQADSLGTLIQRFISTIPGGPGGIEDTGDVEL